MSVALVAVALLLGSGIGYRAVASPLSDFAGIASLPRGTLAQLPLRIGDWVGQDTPVDERILEIAGVGDHVNRICERRDEKAAAREGNVIIATGSPVTVAEACSGLRMLTALVIVAAVLAYVVNRPRWQKVVLIISSIPVAVLCNIARVMVTAVWPSFPDSVGWAMMPLAVLILVAELWIMPRLIVEDQETRVAATS